jgi:hypothetical protein
MDRAAASLLDREKSERTTPDIESARFSAFT